MLGIDRVELGGRLRPGRLGLEILRRLERAIVRPRPPPAKKTEKLGRIAVNARVTVVLNEQGKRGREYAKRSHDVRSDAARPSIESSVDVEGMKIHHKYVC